MAYDKKLTSDVLAVFLRTVNSWYKKKAKEQGYSDVQCGSVTYCQRFGSSLNANLHYHSLVLDGVYVFFGEDDAPVFIPAPTPTDEEIKEVTETTAFRVLRLLERRGVIGEDDVLDPLSDEFPIKNRTCLN